MSRLLPLIMILAMLLGSCAQKEVCPGEVVVRERSKYTPVRTSSERAINKMAKPSLIHGSKSHAGRKPPKSSTIYSAKSNSARRPPK